jgi:hypothetical protein
MITLLSLYLFFGILFYWFMSNIEYNVNDGILFIICIWPIAAILLLILYIIYTITKGKNLK